MKEQILKIIGQLQYEISLLEQSEEDLTGVTIRTEELMELVKKLNIPIQERTINDFINSIDNKVYNKIRRSHSDASCRRYLKEHYK